MKTLIQQLENKSEGYLYYALQALDEEKTPIIAQKYKITAKNTFEMDLAIIKNIFLFHQNIAVLLQEFKLPNNRLQNLEKIIRCAYLLLAITPTIIKIPKESTKIEKKEAPIVALMLVLHQQDISAALHSKQNLTAEKLETLIHKAVYFRCDSIENALQQENNFVLQDIKQAQHEKAHIYLKIHLKNAEKLLHLNSKLTLLTRFQQIMPKGQLITLGLLESLQYLEDFNL